MQSENAVKDTRPADEPAKPLWQRPRIVELPCGYEINTYASAEHTPKS